MTRVHYGQTVRSHALDARIRRKNFVNYCLRRSRDRGQGYWMHTDTADRVRVII